MILVTVGTGSQGFDRLVLAADKLASEISEKVIIQRGCSAYQPRHADYFEWTSGQHMGQLTQEARVVISHAAAGAIILALQMGKPIIISPRLKRNGEALDDHQVQLAQELSIQNKAIMVLDLSGTALQSAINLAVANNVSLQRSERLCQFLKNQIDGLGKPGQGL